MAGDASAYADLLAALLAVRNDPATARFDAELAAAEARGSIDGATARTLRWWQRESLRGLSDHLGAVLPDLLTHLAEAQAEALEAVGFSALSWSAASGPSSDYGRPDSTPDPPVGGSHLRPVDGPALPPPDRPSDPPLPPAPRLLRPGFAPPGPAPEAYATPSDGASRPRLLLSGLTVLTAGESAPDVIDLTDTEPPTSETRSTTHQPSAHRPDEAPR